MKLSFATLWLSLLSSSSWAAPTDNPQQYPLSHRQTQRQAADHVEFLLRNVTMGSIASVFPATSERASHPFVANEYHAPCHTFPSLSFLLLPISQSARNILSDPEGRTSYLIQEQVELADADGRGTGHGSERGNKKKKKQEEGGRSRMDYARVTFTGRMHTINETDPSTNLETLQRCYTSYHPDAKRWLPHTPGAHMSSWARLEVEDVYYVGGFGDLHYIGHIPLNMVHLEADTAAL